MVIRSAAQHSGIGLSEYLRRCAMKRRTETRIDRQSVDDLMHINADLARLGNLMKFAMTEFSDEGDNAIAQKLVLEAYDTMNTIRDQQNLLKQKIIALKG